MLPTAAGCMQAKKIAYVFTSILALMYDQVQQLVSRGIGAAVLDRTYSLLHLAAEYYSEAPIVYLTPEQIPL